jgi:hypothetical protein
VTAGWPFARRELVAVLLLFLLTLPFVTARIYASDEVQYFAWLRSWAFDRDVDFENEYQHFHDAGVARNTPFYETFLVRRNEAGRRENYGPVGSAILWAPFYAAGHVVARLTGQPADGYSQPYVSAVSYGSAIYGGLALLLSAAIARRLVGHGLAASLIVCLGTPLVFYVYVAPPMSHANSAFAVALFLWIWLRVRPEWRPGGAALLGVTGALMGMVRDQDLFFVAGPAIDFLRHALGASDGRKRGALITAAVVGVIAFVAGYSPQLLASAALHGHFGPSDVVSRKMSWTSPHMLQVLFSPAHGFLAWTPLVLLAIVGLVLLAFGRVVLPAGTVGAAADAKRASGSERVGGAATFAQGFGGPPELQRRRERGLGDPASDAVGGSAGAKPPGSFSDVRWVGALALFMFVLQAYVSGAVESWTVQGSFGQRRFVGLTPLLTLGIAAVLRQAATGWPLAGRVAVGLAIVLGIWWNLGLMVQFGTHTMDRQRLTLRENAWTTFVVLPREAPTLVWRYLTDRASFYNRPRQ